MAGFFEPLTGEALIKMNAAFGFPFGPQEKRDWYKCGRCEMGVLGTPRTGPQWQEHHECPEPYPYEQAQYLANFYATSGVPTSLRNRARIKLGLERR